MQSSFFNTNFPLAIYGKPEMFAILTGWVERSLIIKPFAPIHQFSCFCNFVNFSQILKLCTSVRQKVYLHLSPKIPWLS